MGKHGLDHLLVVTDHRVGNAPQWVTGWPGTVEAYVVFRPGEKMTMHVEWYNHFPLAKRLARDVDVRWGEHRGMHKTIEELKRRGARRVGLMGPLLARKQKELERSFSVVELDAEYIRLRTIKSQEEIDCLRIGAAFSDAGRARLHGVRRPDARLRRRLLPADRRHEEPPGGPAARHDAGGEHDGRRAAERDQPRAAGRRAGRRADPRDARRLRAPARSAARFLPGMKPVLVVGAGPVGLATALSLAHQGVPVQVIEAEPALTLDQRAGSYHPPTLEMLAPFAVTEAMHEIGIKVPRWQIRDRRKGVIVEWDLGLIADLTPYPYRFHLEQHRLTPILYEKLKAFPHAQVRFSTGFVDARQSGDSVSVKTTSGELATPWLIGCDGGRSTVRKHLGTPFEGFTWPERFVVISTLADFAQHGFTSNAYVADPREWAAVFHMPGLWRLAFPVHPEENEADVLADEAVEARMQRFVSRPEPYDIPYASIYRVHQRVAKDWRVGRILLAGDAAHLNNPLGAFGLNGGLPDAILLAGYLGRVWRGEADESLLDLYVRQRRTANVEFVQMQSIGNKKMLEEADPAAREGAFAELRRIAADREAARDFLIKSSMIWSVRRAAEVA